MHDTFTRRRLLGAAALGAVAFSAGCKSSADEASGGANPPATPTPAPSPPPPAPQPASLWKTGVNVAGLEFKSSALPGRVGTDYPRPDPAEIRYYQSKGFSTIRLPFRWERAQPQLGGALDSAYVGLIDAVVDQAQLLGMTVLLDAHQYGRRREGGTGYIIGETSVVTSAHFASFWRAMAARYKSKPVIFNLNNEPNGVDKAVLARVQNDAIAAIRNTGASQLILASGGAWSGAHSWVSSGNGAAMLAVTDPANNFAFDVHQYLDSNSSGTSGSCTAGAGTRLESFTAWARENGRRGFLGEFAGGGGADCAPELSTLLSHMRANKDVWLGWTAWGGGAWWANDYPFILRPDSLSNPIDRPQMAVLTQFK